MSAVDIKLRRIFDTTVTPVPANMITAKLTGSVGQSFLEIKIPIDSVPHNTGNDANHRKVDSLPATLKVLENSFYVNPVVLTTEAAGGGDNTNNIKIDLSLVLKSKKPWDGGI